MVDPRLRNDGSDNWEVVGGMMPEVDNNKDLGKAAKQWKDMYYSGEIYRDGVVLDDRYLRLTGGIMSGDLLIYDPVNDANPQLRIGADDANEGHIQAVYDSGAQTLDYLLISTDSAGEGDIVLMPASGFVGIGTTSPSQALDLIGALELEETTTSTTGVIYKGSNRFIHNFHHPTGDSAVPIGNNTFIGVDAGNFTTGSTATSSTHGSYNTAIGKSALSAITLGYMNMAIGEGALLSLTTGYRNVAIGQGALYGMLTGQRNNAVGYRAGRYITGGATANETSTTSIYLGAETKANADGDTNEIVIGYDATGLGSNTVILGNSSITKTQLQGNVGIGIANPTKTLEVVASTATMRITSTSAINASMTFGTNNTDNWVLKANTSDGSFRWRNQIGTPADVFTILQTGEIGIGISVPLAKLHVDQSVSDAAIPVLTLDQADISDGFINFIGSDRGVITGVTDSLKSVRVELGGVIYRLALYVDA